MALKSKATREPPPASPETAHPTVGSHNTRGQTGRRSPVRGPPHPRRHTPRPPARPARPGGERQARQDITEARPQAELPHGSNDRIVIRDPARKSLPIADLLQGIPR